MDWAVLYSLKGVSTIVVFWNASEKNPAAIAPAEDPDSFDPRGIRAVGGEFIMRHYEAYGASLEYSFASSSNAEDFLQYLSPPLVWNARNSIWHDSGCDMSSYELQSDLRMARF